MVYLWRHSVSSFNPRLLLAGSLTLMLMLPVTYSLAQPGPDPRDDQEYETSPDQYYMSYSEQAMEHYRKGESTKAITLMNQAFALAPQNTAVINNLAACYIQRGVYYHNSRKDLQNALSDYRQALFLLVHDWPSQVDKTDVREKNIAIIEDNLSSIMASMKVPANDWKWHLKSAWELRRRGNLQEAMVEYAEVTRINPKNAEAWQAQGDIYTVRQKPDKAVSVYQKAVESSTSASDSLYVKLGTALFMTENPEKAVEALNKALEINPKNKDALLALEQVWKKEITLNPRNMSAHLNLGAVYQQLGRYDDAFAQYQVSDRLSPNNSLVKRNLASLFQAKGDVNQALMMYDGLLQQNPADASTMLLKADILRQHGRSQEAEQLLQRALQSSPDKKRILDQLVSIHRAQGNPNKLKDTWQLYATTFPQDADVQYQAGLAFHEAKDYTAAIGYYQNAVRLNPKLAAAYANLGTAFHAVSQDAEAVQALKKAQSLDPNLEEVALLLSAIERTKGSKALVEASELHNQGQYQQAIKAYEQALKQDTENPEIYARYGLALQAVKRYPQALSAYDKAISLDPDNGTYYYYKGSLYDAQNSPGSAKTLYEKALSLDSSLTQAQQALDSLKTSASTQQLAQALEAYNKKNYSKSLMYADEVLKVDPTNALAYYYKGLVYDAQQKFSLAQGAYEKSLNLDPTMSDAAYALAVVLDTQGKKTDAKKTFEQFIQLMKDQPEDDFVKYAKTRLSVL